jgi:hypothetical protein
MKSAILATALAQLASAAILWDGRFNDMSSAADLDKWSWGNQVGPYQWYIHGSGSVTEYVNLSPSYKNPSDSGSSKGAKISLTSSAYWNGQNMRRTEIIPQTSAAIASGKVFYHFSIKREDTNAPSVNREHQIAFFESHFTELKSGWISGAAGTSDPELKWMVGGQTKWAVNWDAGVWHNVAYEIDFSGNKVGFWHSTGSDPLEQIVAPISASTSSNGADWHVGVLELPRSGYPDSNEDFYFSGVYIENGSITTSVSGPGSNNGGGSSSSSSRVTSTASKTTSSPSSSWTSASSTTSKATVSTTAMTTSTTKAPVESGASQWGQCGGSNWAGPTACASPYSCSSINPWYYQCV